MGDRYETRIVPVSELADDAIDRMASLYLANFDGSSNEIFRGDLVDKDESILLYHDKVLVGFTALKVFDTAWDRRQIRVVYSGDTLVARAHWGQQALAFAWISRIGEIKRAAPGRPLFWFLLVKGHRTFKYLPVFAKSFFPHWSEYRADLKALADRLAAAKFGGHYDPVSGLVKFPESRGHLKKEIVEPAAEEMKKTATRFFLERNPDYRLGHELVCLCELESFNMKPLAARLFRKKNSGGS